MPLHDWTRVDAGIFHHFHLYWIAEIARALNSGLLPREYYALGEQVAGDGSPDVLALREPGANGHSPADDPEAPGGVALLTAAPRTRLVARAAPDAYTAARRTLAIRHVSADRVVALIEIVSSGNKAGARPWNAFLDKVIGALQQGVHLLIVDVYPPTARDPDGVHGAVWAELDSERYRRPADADRTLVAYSAGSVKMAYIEPVAVGQPLHPMPLFLTPDGVGHVEVPLEATYAAAYAGLPRRYQATLDAPPPDGGPPA